MKRQRAAVVLMAVALCLTGAVHTYAEEPPDCPSRLGDVANNKKTVTQDDATPPTIAPATESSDRVLVRFAANTSDSERVTALDDISADLLDSYSLVPGLSVIRTDTVTQTIQALEARADVLYAEPDYPISLDECTCSEPNDPHYGLLWGMENINAPDAWCRPTGDADMLVAVIDSGVNYTHPDLAANMWTNPGEFPSNGIDDDGNGYVDDVYGYDFCNNDADPMDDNGHGSHCAGTIGAVGDNNTGVVGVNWNAKIMALKFLSDEGTGWTSDAVACIEYAVQMGATVSSNSWGGPGYSAALYDAIQASQSIGHLFIAAAGNDYASNDVSPQYPASYTLNNIISVAAINSDESLRASSNWGASSVDLGAPGSSIYSTVLGSSYSYMGGTSMAAPHVSGAAALLYGIYPNLGYQEVRDLILDTARPASSMSGKTVTGGVLDVGAAVDAGPCMGSGDTPDLDCDGKTDIIVWRPANGTWYGLLSSRCHDAASYFAKPWGSNTHNDVPIAGDLDGDNKMDLIVWRPASGTWYGLLSSQGYSTASYFSKAWGSSAHDDMPLAGDIDGDGKMDLIIWRPAAGKWYALHSSRNYSTAATFSKTWGSAAHDDVPILADLDGDDRADLVVWRPASGKWYALLSSRGYSAASPFSKTWGSAAHDDVPIAQDLDGDGKADLIVWRPTSGTWYALLSSQGYSTTSCFSKRWGSGACDDEPVASDLDGDGKMDLTVWRPANGTWYGLLSSEDYSTASSFAKTWGSKAHSDAPITGR